MNRKNIRATKDLYSYAKLYKSGIISESDFKDYFSFYIQSTTEDMVNCYMKRAVRNYNERVSCNV